MEAKRRGKNRRESMNMKLTVCENLLWKKKKGKKNDLEVNASKLVFHFSSGTFRSVSEVEL